MSETTEPASATISVLDEPWHRLPLVLILALVFWCGLLFLFALVLTPPVSHPDEVEAELVELPPTGLAGGGGGSAGAEQISSARKSAKPAPVAKVKAKTLPAAPPHLDKARASDVLPSRDLVEKDLVPHVNHADNLKPISNAAAASRSIPAQLNGAVAAGEGGIGNGTGTGAGNGVGEGSNTGAGGGFGSGGSGPQAFYAPVPSIPDDMRDEVLQAEAVARFRVSHDGNATVSLAKPTDFSRLNDIILDTLRTWRFHPASRNGVAIDSDAEVRLLITVQ
jgi:protein TonB